MNRLLVASALSILLLPAHPAAAETLDGKLHHLRSGKTREWSEFPAAAEGDRFELSFEAAKNTAPATLVLRQRDVKMAWRVVLNKKRIGQLIRDENDQLIRFPVPAGALRSRRPSCSGSRSGGATPPARCGQGRAPRRPRSRRSRSSSSGAANGRPQNAGGGRALPRRRASCTYLSCP